MSQRRTFADQSFSLVFGGLTLLNMRAEIMNTRAEMLMQRRQAAE
jgi:hypothetical protein